MNQGAGSGGEVEGPLVGKRIAGEFMFDLAHLYKHRAGLLGQLQSGRRGHQMLAPPNEEFGLQMVGERMHLQADSAGRQVILLSRPGYARFLDHGQK